MLSAVAEARQRHRVPHPAAAGGAGGAGAAGARIPAAAERGHGPRHAGLPVAVRRRALLQKQADAALFLVVTLTLQRVRLLLVVIMVARAAFPLAQEAKDGDAGAQFTGQQDGVEAVGQHALVRVLVRVLVELDVDHIGGRLGRGVLLLHAHELPQRHVGTDMLQHRLSWPLAVADVRPVDEAHACLVADMLLKARRGAGVEPDHEVVGVDERAQLIEQRAAAVADHCTGARASSGT
mmetsp:Transcript_6230/g.16079  ORF Transcript_6230/g.16079 Transcript_6230/m.16079 type:complete len:237 (-) Transcript_6230:990-1700(-)